MNGAPMDYSTIGLIAGIISFLGFFPYISDAIKGRIKPNKATWLILAAVNILIAASYKSAGATDTFWVALANAVGMVLIAGISLGYGQKDWTGLDKACLLGAGLGLGAWILTGNPVYAYVIATLGDGSGMLPTVVKAYKDPDSERSLTWPVWVWAYALALLAISGWTIVIALYPAYLFSVCLIMSALTYIPRGRKAG
jgi:hypothetical protein